MIENCDKRGGLGILGASAAFLFYALKWYNCVVMMMDDYKISENFQCGAGCKMISPHHSHPANGVSPSDSDLQLSHTSCISTIGVNLKYSYLAPVENRGCAKAHIVIIDCIE